MRAKLAQLQRHNRQLLCQLALWRLAGTGNGLLAGELAARGCQRVTGSDYSQASVQLAAALAKQRQDVHTQWVVDDMLDTRLEPGCACQGSLGACKTGKACIKQWPAGGMSSQTRARWRQ